MHEETQVARHLNCKTVLSRCTRCWDTMVPIDVLSCAFPSCTACRVKGSSTRSLGIKEQHAALAISLKYPKPSLKPSLNPSPRVPHLILTVRGTDSMLLMLLTTSRMRWGLVSSALPAPLLQMMSMGQPQLISTKSRWQVSSSN